MQSVGGSLHLVIIPVILLISGCHSSQFFVCVFSLYICLFIYYHNQDLLVWHGDLWSVAPLVALTESQQDIKPSGAASPALVIIKFPGWLVQQKGELILTQHVSEHHQRTTIGKKKTRAHSSGEDDLTFSECVAQTGVPGQQGLLVVEAQQSSLLEAQDGQSEGYTFPTLRHLQAADLLQGDASTLPGALRFVPLVFKHQQHQAVWTHTQRHDTPFFFCRTTNK